MKWPLRNCGATYLRDVTDTVQTVQYSDSQCTLYTVTVLARASTLQLLACRALLYSTTTFYRVRVLLCLEFTNKCSRHMTQIYLQYPSAMPHNFLLVVGVDCQTGPLPKFYFALSWAIHICPSIPFLLLIEISNIGKTFHTVFISHPTHRIN